MKIIGIIKELSKQMSESQINKFIYDNLPDEMIRGLEYDDPDTIKRTLLLLGLKTKEQLSEEGDKYEEEQAAAS